MPKLIHIFIALLLFTQSAFSVHLIYRPKPYNTNLSKVEASKINHLLETYEWPSAIDLFSDESGVQNNQKNIDQYGQLLSTEPFAESNFLRAQVKKISPQLEVIWIPTTLWEIFTISYRYMKSTSSDMKAERPAMTKQLLAMLKNVGIFTPGALPQFDKEKLSSAFEQMLKKLKGPGKGEADLYLNDDLKEALIAEMDSLKSKNSVILAAAQAEIDAQKKNNALLFRATPGIPISASEDGKGPLALDFIVPVVAAPQFEKSTKPDVETSLSNLKTMLKTKKYESRDISYQYSLLGGCLDDPGICPFYYLRVRNTPISYALSLTKKFAYTRGKQLFYFPKLFSQTFLNQEGILGHPRFRRIGPLRNFDASLGGKAFELKAYKPLPASVVQAQGSPAQQKFLSFLFEAMGIISNSSRVVSIGEDAVLGTKDMTAEQMKKTQWAAFELLKEAIRGGKPKAR